MRQVSSRSIEQLLNDIRTNEKALGPDHSSKLRTANNPGGLYSHQGKAVEAEEVYQRARASKEKALRSDRTST